MQVAIQSNVWSPERHEDLGGVYNEIAAAGYDGVEIGAHRIDIADHAGLRAMAAERSLRYASLHVHGELHDANWAVQAAARLDEVAACAQVLGAPYMALSGRPKIDKSEAELRAQSDNLNRAGEIAARHGVRLCYHNHYWEIAADRAELRSIVAGTDPALVSLCLDVAWVVRGGAPLVETVESVLGRIGYFHIKDTRDGAFTELGRGTVDFAALFAHLQGRYDGWLCVERDEVLPDALASARECRAYLKQQFGI